MDRSDLIMVKLDIHLLATALICKRRSVQNTRACSQDQDGFFSDTWHVVYLTHQPRPGSMFWYSAQIFICFVAYILQSFSLLWRGVRREASNWGKCCLLDEIHPFVYAVKRTKLTDKLDKIRIEIYIGDDGWHRNLYIYINDIDQWTYKSKIHVSGVFLHTRKIVLLCFAP